MKGSHTTIAAIAFALALPIAIGAGVDPAAAEGDIASNSQLRGQYAGTNSGGCLISLSGFDQNDRPIDPTRSYSNVFGAEVVFTFDGNGRGHANFTTNTELRVPGTNASFVGQLNLSTGESSFTYSVGPKHTVTLTMTDLTFKILNGPSAGLTVMIDKVALEGHYGPNGVTLTKIDGAVEVITPPTGSPFPRICERSFVLLSDRSHF